MCLLTVYGTIFQNREFYKFGVYTVLSIINNGSGAPFFAPAVYNYFFTGNMHVEGVPDYLEPSLKLFVNGVSTFKGISILKLFVNCLVIVSRVR